MPQYLQAFAVADTRSAEEMQGILSGVYDARFFEPARERERFSAKAGYFNFGTSNLSYCSYGSPTRIGFRDDAYLRLQIGLAGNGHTSAGQHRSDVSLDTIVCSPAEADLDFGPAFEQLALRVSHGALDQDLAFLLGTRAKHQLSFDMASSAHSGQSGRLRDLIVQAALIIDASDEPIPAPVLREMEQTIRIALLYGIPNSHSSLLYSSQKTSAPWQVKLIEEWIDANWREGVTIEKLMEISGASARSIFATFKRTRGYSPMVYLKTVRLQAAHEMLLVAAPGTTVTGVSFACNFMNPGHFARDYKNQFGELPSATLAHSRERGR